MDIFIDQELRAIISPLQQDELKELEASLIKEGNRETIVVWKETRLILDGHHRYEFCNKHGISLKPPHELSLPDRDVAKIWIIENQLGRRNLSLYQRSVLVLQREDIYREIAKRNQDQATKLQRDEKGRFMSNPVLTMLSKLAEPINTDAIKLKRWTRSL